MVRHLWEHFDNVKIIRKPKDDEVKTKSNDKKEQE